MINVKLLQEETGQVDSPGVHRWFITSAKLFSLLEKESNEDLLMLVLQDREIQESYQKISARSHECEVRNSVKQKMLAFQNSLTTEEMAIVQTMSTLR